MNAVFDRSQIDAAIALLFEPGQVVELRALEVPQAYGRSRTVSGYFNDFAHLAEEAAKLSGKAKGVYVTLNHLDPALLARRGNRAEPAEEREPLTGDGNVLRRRWFAIDLDPGRPAGISSSDGEHEAALARAVYVRTTLRDLGWPEPVLADSGNGAHLLYRVELPSDDDGLLKGCLEALHERLGGDGIAIDRTVFNPARIWKLYGTLAKKGDDTPGRPHRLARLIHVPDGVSVVPIELLQALGATAPRNPPSKTSTSSSSRPVFDLEGWIARNAPQLEGPSPWQGGQIWKFKVCPWNPDHRNTSAFVARLPGGGISAGCHHDGCTGRTWADLRALYFADAPDAPDGADDARPASRTGSIATRLLKLVQESGTELWHTPAGDAYFTVSRHGHLEHFPLKGRHADLWLRLLHYESSGGGAPAGSAITDTLAVLRGQAVFDGAEHDAFVRVGEHDGDFYIDLGDPDWSAVRVSDRGWEIVSRPPVRFRRPRALRPLPHPRVGGGLHLLRPFLNVASEDDFRLVLSFIVSSFWPRGPYPIVIFNGEQGSAKSTNSRILRALIDPSSTPLRAQPRDGRDLMIMASNSWVLALDNLSDLPPWLSDAFCRLSTGGGFSTRELYTDDEEIFFEAQRPIVLNGIEELASRSDLLDRALLLVLPAIRPRQRRDERRFWSDFHAASPLIFGALLDALVVARRDVGTIDIRQLPRLADFALRGAAAAPVLGWSATVFLAAYAENRAMGHAGAIESSVIARTLMSFLLERQSWEGNASKLLAQLAGHAGDAVTRDKHWPKSALGLSNALRRIAADLRATGLDIDFVRDTGRGRTRLIRITRSEEVEEEASVPSAASGLDSIAADAPSDDQSERPNEASDDPRFDSDGAGDADAQEAPFIGPDRCDCGAPAAGRTVFGLAHCEVHWPRCMCEGCDAHLERVCAADPELGSVICEFCRKSDSD